LINFIENCLNSIKPTEYRNIHYVGVNLDSNEITNFKIYNKAQETTQRCNTSIFWDYLKYDKAAYLSSVADYQKQGNNLVSSKKADYFVNKSDREGIITSLSNFNRFFNLDIDVLEFIKVGDLIQASISPPTYPITTIGVELDQNNVAISLRVYYRTRLYKQERNGQFVGYFDNPLLLKTLGDLNKENLIGNALMEFLDSIVDSSLFNIYLLGWEKGRKNSFLKRKVYFQNINEQASLTFINYLAANAELSDLISPDRFQSILDLIKSYDLFMDGFCITSVVEKNHLNLYFKPNPGVT
jgi:type IV secretory pathway VirB3-like protein